MSNPVVIDATPGRSFVDISREFDAPAAVVYAAHADKESFATWIGPRSLSTDITHWDFRSGGGYSYAQTDAEGDTFVFRGVFHTVRENELIIQTFEYEGVPDEVSLDIMRFEDLPGGRTRIVGRSVFPSVEVVEAMLAAGMTDGMNEGYEKLDELLAGR